MVSLVCPVSRVLFVAVLLVVMYCTCGDPGSRLLPAQSCSLTEGLLYVVTVDGSVTVISEYGQVRWEYQTGMPLFHSSLNQYKDKEMSQLIVPGLDRGLYTWDGIKLNQLPFTADHLVENTHLHKGRGTFLTGAKTKDMVGINLHSGKAVYECSHQKCHRYDNQSMIRCMDILKLSLSRVMVREADERTGEELWNFTVGDMQLSLVEEEEGQDWEDQHSCRTRDMDFDLHVRTLVGVVYATERSASGQVLWEVQLSSPVVSVWLHVGGKLELLDIPYESGGPECSDSSSELPVLPPPGLMMLHFNDQFYLQPLRTWPVALAPADSTKQTFTRQFNLVLPENLLQSEDEKEESEGVVSSSPTSLSLYYSTDLFEDLSTAGPCGEAIYFFVDPVPSFVESNTSNCSSAAPGDSSESCPAPDRPVLPDWTVTVATVAKYGLFAIFVLALNKIRRMFSGQRRRQNSTSSSSDGVEEDEQPDLHLNVLRQSSSIESAATLTPLTPSYQNGSTPQFVTQMSGRDSEPQLICRFESEYDLKGRLGKGGFGVVYHVQNKTDGGEYALKRIKLPLQRAARDKVMREVRALAQLDHPRIVRYYNSWVEKVSQGWSDIEEHANTSRRSSISIVQDSPSSSAAVPVSIGVSSCSTSSHLVPPAPSCSSSHPLLHRAKASPGQAHAISPSPSFNSLSHSNIHSTLPPLSSDSRSSSFVIEFNDDCHPGIEQLKLSADGRHSPQVDSDRLSSSVTMSESRQDSRVVDGCFKQALVSRQDSMSGDGSHSTEDREEQRDSVADLGAESPTFLFIQMQLCQKESLKDWLRANIIDRSRQKVLHFFDQILDAVSYVHGKDMMHRDLKPSNIFFSLDGLIKVGDFGLVTSSTYGGLQNSYVTLKGLGEEQGGGQHTGNLGSHFYMSPEQVLGKKYNRKVDIFSLGIILFELHHPFATSMERAKVLEDVRNSKFPSNFEATLPLEAGLVKWLTARHATERPFVKEIYANENFKALRTTVTGTIPKL